jgi:hypothetical protein
MKEPIGLVPAADVGGRETCLQQDAGRQVASLADLAVGGDGFALRKLFKANTKFIDRDIHCARDVTCGKLLWGSHIQNEWTLVGQCVDDGFHIEMG